MIYHRMIWRQFFSLPQIKCNFPAYFVSSVNRAHTGTTRLKLSLIFLSSSIKTLTNTRRTDLLMKKHSLYSCFLELHSALLCRSCFIYFLLNNTHKQVVACTSWCVEHFVAWNYWNSRQFGVWSSRIRHWFTRSSLL